jgi:hypothetical protein
MSKVRRCDKRCHTARGTRCRCWCGGFFHGSSGAANRAALIQAATDGDRDLLLQNHGFKEGKTTYVEQQTLPVEVS